MRYAVVLARRISGELELCEQADHIVGPGAVNMELLQQQAKVFRAVTAEQMSEIDAPAHGEV